MLRSDCAANATRAQCECSLTTSGLLVTVSQKPEDISQRSVATRERCGGFFADRIMYCRLFFPVEQFSIFPKLSCEYLNLVGLYIRVLKSKGSPHSATERRVPELIPVLGSQPAGDVSHKPSGRLPLLSARPAVTPATLKRAAISFAAW